ncbi:MAG: putative lipid II flippase FtsW, partial [Methanothrix sp.]|nr:putative lipid II flippase FtsW [Methanothrix sp.]
MNPDQRTTRRRTSRSQGRFFGLTATQPLAVKNPGQGASSPARPQKLASDANHRIVQLRVDVPLLLTLITLLIFGLVMVYSASYDYSYLWYGVPSAMFVRQLMWMVTGVCVMVFLAFFNYHRLRYLAVLSMGVTVCLLVAVLFVNIILNGATRTLLGGSIQPSELAKLVTVMYLAVWLDAKRERLSNVSFGLIPLAAILGLLGGLIIMQPDLSAVVTIFMLGGLMFFLAGGDLRQIGVLLIVAVLVGWAVVQISPTGVERIQDYLAGLKNPSQGSYHVQRAFEAFVRGGWFGVGIGKAEVKLTGLPVPPTDSIFAVVGEETGVIGAVVLVGLYVLLLWRGLIIAQRAPDQLGALLASGLTIWICIEAFINMAVMLNLVPFAGNALPFISAGGSNLNVVLAAIGIVLNVSRLSEQKKEEN